MALGKQAKVLTSAQVRTTLQFLTTTRNPKRDTVMFLLSMKAGFRAKEIATVTWAMLTDSEGQIADVIELQDFASKGKGGRSIPMNKELKSALVELLDEDRSAFEGRGYKFNLDRNVISSERGSSMSANSVVHWFKRLYANLGFEGCSSHSGRRSAITAWSRGVVKAGGSLRDVQSLAGHSSLALTQLYIDQNADAKRLLVDMV